MITRLLHYGTPVAIPATLRRGKRIWWATPLQHRLLVNCLYHSGLTSRQRAAMLGCSQHAVVQNLRSWTKKGVLRYHVEGRGRAARSTVFLCGSVPPLQKPLNEPTSQRRGCISLGKVTTKSHVVGGLIHQKRGPAVLNEPHHVHYLRASALPPCLLEFTTVHNVHNQSSRELR